MTRPQQLAADGLDVEEDVVEEVVTELEELGVSAGELEIELLLVKLLVTVVVLEELETVEDAVEVGAVFTVGEVLLGEVDVGDKEDVTELLLDELLE